MQAGAQALALERQLFGETLADDPQHGHLPVGPFDTFAAGGCESEIMYVMFIARNGGHGIPPEGNNS
jgi:hypothetical protein